MKKDFYDILGVKRTATQSEIRKAYRKLARKFHPDVNPGNSSAENRFKEISEAYHTLNDPEKRTSYDQHGHLPFSQGPSQSEHSHNPFGGFDFGSAADNPFAGNPSGSFSDFFRDVFSRTDTMNPPEDSAPDRGEDQHSTIDISFSEAYSGITTEILASGYETCPICRGSGSQMASQSRTCPDCHGTGQRTVNRGAVSIKQRCSRCGGSGQIIQSTCENCHGTGSIAKPKRITVKIPAGVDTGSKIRLAGQGKPGRIGAPPGDLFITTKVQPHPFFKRNGNSIMLDLPITISEAILGARVVIPLVIGSGKLTIPPGTSSERTFRLSGKGFPDLKGGKTGDLMIVVHIETPAHVSESAKNLIREFERLCQHHPRESMEHFGND